MRPTTVSLCCAAVCLSLAAFGAETETKNGNEMSLVLYQKLKAHFDALYGAQMPTLPGIEPVSRSQTETKLRTDAASNKGAILKALGAGSVIHRELAARALEYCGDKTAAVNALIQIVNTDSDDGVRRAAATALAKLPDAAAVEALIRGLTDSADAVRSSCATALGNVKDPRATEPLLKLLGSDPKPMARMLAANALSKIKDKACVEPLGKALETEKDERVKMAIAGAVRAASGGDSAKTEAVPSAGEAANELATLAKEMRDVEQKLREDRHDQSVQTQGQGIEQKLAALIQKLDKGCNNSGNNSSSEDKNKQQQKQRGDQSNSGKSSSSPLKDSSLGSPVAPGATNAAMVAGKQDAWAKLPPQQRDELLQAYREEIPERWRRRLEAYFLSIAVEEAKDADK